MKKYIVAERNRSRDAFDFVNEDTTDLGDIWHTHCPYKLDNDQIDRLKPLVFEKRAEAVKYKDTQQSQANHDWRENGYIHKRYGHSKSKWKVEEYNCNLF